MSLEPKYDNYDFPLDNPGAREGFYGNTTDMQNAQVYQLRAMLEQEGYKDRLDTLSLLRFLRARKWNVEHSKAMFMHTEKWRKDFKTDELVDTWSYPEKPKVFEFYPQYYHKTDIDGRPCYIEKLGKIDLGAMMKITTEERMLTNLVFEYEKSADPRLPACSRKSHRLLETCCTIIDLKGVGITNMPQVYGYLKRASVISQDYYPERLGKLFIINAPWGFSGAFNIVKGFLDPATVDKIHVLGWSYQVELLKHIPAENLPKEFGGECECEGGCELSDDGPWKDPQWMTPGAKLDNTQHDAPTATTTAPPAAPAAAPAAEFAPPPAATA